MTHYPIGHNHIHTLRPPPALPSTLTPRHGQRRRHWELQNKTENGVFPNTWCGRYDEKLYGEGITIHDLGIFGET